jgi:hypothetical protein
LHPNDRAFTLLAFNLTGIWYLTETQILKGFEGLVQAYDVNLANVLIGHVDKASVPFNAPVPPKKNGDTIEFKPCISGFFIESRDNVSAFRNPFLVRMDIGTGNSVIQSIYRVLISVNVANLSLRNAARELRSEVRASFLGNSVHQSSLPRLRLSVNGDFWYAPGVRT